VCGGEDYYEVHQLKMILSDPMEPEEVLRVISKHIAGGVLPEEVQRSIGAAGKDAPSTLK
jgi:hypothetical protein